MTDTYAGDSWAKRMVRVDVWNQCIQHESLGDRLAIAYLASRDANDYRVLSAMGHEDRSIGYERQYEAFALARARFPIAHLRHGDVSDGEEPLSIAMLDFCSPICDPVVRVVAKVLNRIREGGVVCVWVLRGRDMSRSLKSLANRSTRRAMGIVDHGLAGWTGGIGTCGCTECGIARRSAALSRLIYAYSRITIRHVLTIEYSATSPMTAMVFTKGQLPGPVAHPYPREYERIVGGEDKFRASCKRYALASTMSSESVANVLCIDAGTVRAWRAHSTRGTYACRLPE